MQKLLFATIVVCFCLSNLPAQSTSTIVPGRTVVDQVLHVALSAKINFRDSAFIGRLRGPGGLAGIICVARGNPT